MKQIFSVAQVNAYIKRMFQSDYALRRICIKGEVSNCKYHSSGHIYFSLKDDKSQISCIMFAGNVKNGLQFTMEDGQTVTAQGNIGIYERNGTYQFYADSIEAQGMGQLYIEFEKLKQKLYEEGLFEHEHKKPIPKYPKRIGVVTSRTGAAIQDILSVAKRRNPYVQMILYPAKVQGEGAGATIAEGIRRLDQEQVDMIIIGRGGGSIEDLWAFNEEIVARAVYDAHTPIISGTGHEIDTTIADYAADLRAATPTAACELALPDVREMIDDIGRRKHALDVHLRQILQQYQLSLEQYSGKIRKLDPKLNLQEHKMTLAEIEDRLHQAVKNMIQKKKHQAELYVERLHGLSPTAKLTGGYGYIESKDQKPVTSVKEISPGDLIKMTISDGDFLAKAVEIHPREEKNGGMKNAEKGI